MDLQRLKANKWKIFVLIVVGLFILAVIAGHSKIKMRRVSLTDEQSKNVIELAKNSVRDRITDEFTVTSLNFGRNIELSSGETTTLVHVHFVSPEGNLTYSVIVDLNGKRAIQIVESRDFMTRQRNYSHRKRRLPFFFDLRHR
jgi:hypothetical protein